jgi:hypothetical protein
MAAAEALVSLTALVAFACLFYGPWQAVCTDVARQIIFERRDILFDLARSGKLDFSSAEYKTLRRSMEGFIRYAHELTWLNLLFHRTKVKRLKGEAPVTLAIASISDPFTREKVDALVNDCMITLVGMIAAKSILTAPIVSIVAIYALCTHSFNSLVRQKSALVTRLSSTIQSGAECAI